MSQHPVSREYIRGLVEAEETYRHLVEGIPAVVYIDAVDEFSTNLYTSPQIEALMGISPEEWQSEPAMFIDLLHPDDRERVVDENNRSNATLEPFHTEYRLIDPDGRVVWFRDDAVIVRDGSGAPLFWRGIMLDVTDRKQAEDKLRRSLEILRQTMEERRQLLYRLEEAQEQERRRIAADIHDDPIQAMSAADIRLQLLAEEATGTELGTSLEEVHRLVTDSIERLRNLLFELRPPALDREGLAATVRLYLQQAASEDGLAYEVADLLAEEPPAEMRATLFRIAQEGITNVRKHAAAERIDVLLETADGGVRVRITDDGRGFDASALREPERGHLGLPSMIERAELAGGWCRIDSAPGTGTSVECWLPITAVQPAGSRSA